jgi:hypothetical protein
VNINKKRVPFFLKKMPPRRRASVLTRAQWKLRVTPRANFGPCAPGPRGAGFRSPRRREVTCTVQGRSTWKTSAEPLDITPCFTIATMLAHLASKNVDVSDLGRRPAKSDVLALFNTHYRSQDEKRRLCTSNSRRRINASCYPELSINPGGSCWLATDDIQDFIHVLNWNTKKPKKVVPLHNRNQVPYEMEKLVNLNVNPNLAGKDDWSYAVTIPNVSNSHWVVILVQRQKRKKIIEYFDAKNRSMSSDIRNYIDRINQQLFDGEAEIDEEGILHQKHNISCGLYALWFLWNRVNGRTKSYLNRFEFTDKEACELRPFFFIEKKQTQ